MNKTYSPRQIAIVLLGALLVGAAILAGCILYVARRTADHPAPTGAAVAAPNVERVPSAVASATAPTSGRALAAPTPDGRHEYAAAADVEAYLAGLADAGNGSAALARAYAIDECAASRNRPNYIAELLEMHKHAMVPNLDTVQRYAARTVERCSKFNTGARTGLKDLEDQYELAEQQGSQAAKARNLARDVMMATVTAPGPIATSDLQPVVIDLLSSGDPDVILATSDLLGETSRLKGAAAGSSVADAAWKLVACDLGLDCSYGSPLMRELCLNGGVYCGNGDLRANMINSGFPPEAYSRVQELERRIYQAVRDGNIESLFDTPG